MMSRLFSTTAVPAIAGRINNPHLRRYAQEEDGAVTIFATVVILMLVLIAGISFDLQRNEMDRVRIQNTADRAVLWMRRTWTKPYRQKRLYRTILKSPASLWQPTRSTWMRA